MQVDGVELEEVIDTDTNRKTLLVKRNATTGQYSSLAALPNVRMVATPAGNTTNSSLFSEVTIRFKTV